MNVLRTLPLALLLVACGPNTDDRTNMKEKMDVDDQRAAIWKSDAKNCAKMATDLAAFSEANRDKTDRIDKWWNRLSATTKKTLIGEYQPRWDAQDKALVGATIACPKEVKVTVKQ